MLPLVSVMVSRSQSAVLVRPPSTVSTRLSAVAPSECRKPRVSVSCQPAPLHDLDLHFSRLLFRVFPVQGEVPRKEAGIQEATHSVRLF